MNCDIKNSEVWSIFDVENSMLYWTYQSAWRFCRKMLQVMSIKSRKLVGTV